MQHDHQYSAPEPARKGVEPAGGKLLATVAVWGTVVLVGGVLASALIALIVTLWRVIL